LADFITAIDQGTTSTRCILFDRDGKIVSTDQKEHAQIMPQPGWVEHDPREILAHTREVVDGALARAGLTATDIAAAGLTNQRETTVLWDRRTGAPLYNAIVWQDTRTEAICRDLAGDKGPDRFREATGLPLATYFAGPKMRWLLDNVPGAREKAESGDALFGTVDSYLLWWLTGGPSGGLHATDVTNASRTLLMDLRTLDWDPAILETTGIPRAALPAIRTSSEVYGEISESAIPALAGAPIAGVLGDQQAALFGQTCFQPGEAKNTYGTGCFLLLNTGTTPVPSQYGLLTSVGYKRGEEPAVYVLEGSIAVTGALAMWQLNTGRKTCYNGIKA
jgi:glycerol kinase